VNTLLPHQYGQEVLQVELVLLREGETNRTVSSKYETNFPPIHMQFFAVNFWDRLQRLVSSYDDNFAITGICPLV
jgi:hypothetical protein